MYPVVLVVNFISDRQYKNKNKFLTKENTSLLIAVRGYQRSPRAYRAGDLKVHMFIRQPRAEQVRLEIMRHNGRSKCTMKIQIRSLKYNKLSIIK